MVRRWRAHRRRRNATRESGVRVSPILRMRHRQRRTSRPSASRVSGGSHGADLVSGKHDTAHDESTVDRAKVPSSPVHGIALSVEELHRDLVSHLLAGSARAGFTETAPHPDDGPGHGDVNWISERTLAVLSCVRGTFPRAAGSILTCAVGSGSRVWIDGGTCRTQSERVRKVDRIPRRKPITVQPPRQPNRVKLRDMTGST